MIEEWKRRVRIQRRRKKKKPARRAIPARGGQLKQLVGVREGDVPMLPRAMPAFAPGWIPALAAAPPVGSAPSA